MARGYSGADVLLDIDAQYEYKGHQANSFDEIVNLMNISLVHRHGDDLVEKVTDFKLIAENMEELAKSFILQNQTYKTGNLYKSVKATVNGHTVNLNAPARDSRGHPYAGHIEYGFTGRDGLAHGPWPFLRPAVRLAAADSRNALGDSLARFLIDEVDYRGQMAFGRSGNRINSARGAKIARDTRKQFGTGKGGYWKNTYHGIREKSDSYSFHTSDSYHWMEGDLYS